MEIDPVSQEGVASPMDIDAAAFFGLPRELRDEIYRLAFVKNETSSSKIIALEEWMRQEREQRRINARLGQRPAGTINPRAVHPRAIPTCPLLNMLVNKQFFEEAATSFLRYQTIECDDMRTLNHLCKASKQLRSNLTRLVCKWDIGAQLSPHPLLRYFEGIASCQSLRDLYITVTDDVFDSFKNRLACCHEFGQREFSQMYEVKELLHMKSLEKVKLVARPSRLATTDVEQLQWRKNVAGLEQYINQQLQKVKQEREAKLTQSKAKKQDQQTGEPDEASEVPRGFWASLKHALDGRSRKPKVTNRKAPKARVVKRVRKVLPQVNLTGNFTGNFTGEELPTLPQRPVRIEPPTTNAPIVHRGSQFTRKHIAMTAGIAFAVSSVNSLVLMKLMSS